MKKLVFSSLAAFGFAVITAGAIFLSGVTTSQAICAGDNDCDGFSNSIENHVGTDHRDACGPNAWPPDFNNDTFVDTADIGMITPFVGQNVPPAPVRFDLAPEPEGDNFIFAVDLARVTSLFGESCATP